MGVSGIMTQTSRLFEQEQRLRRLSRCQIPAQEYLVDELPLKLRKREKERGLFMELGHWDIILWISGYAGNICLMAVLCAKKRYKAFPWFTLFLANELVQDPLLALIAHYGSAKHYFYTYWSLDVLDSLLLLLVIFELSRAVKRVTDENKNLFRTGDLFWLATAVLIMGIGCW